MVSGVTVSLHLEKLDLTSQKPCCRDPQRDEHEIERVLTHTCPRIQRLAKKLGADIGFEDEASVVLPRGRRRYSVTDDKVDAEESIACLEQLIRGRERPLIWIMDHASFHPSKKVRDFVRAHRSQLRVFFLPKCAPELNPDEQVWNELKNNEVGKRPIKNKSDLRTRLHSKLRSLQRKAKRMQSFFRLPDTRYAAEYVR